MATVNRPTNVQTKDKDINTKLQLYGIISAFSMGKVPSNKQIDVALNSALQHRALSKPSPKLSAEGRELVADLRQVIEEAKYLLLTKNEGNLLQDFIWQTQNISVSQAKKPGVPIDKSTAQQHGDKALEGLRTLGNLILSNGQFRKLLNDASILLRDMVSDAAQKTGDVASGAAQKIGGVGQDYSSKVGDLGQEYSEKAGDKSQQGISTAGDKAQDASGQAGDKAKEASGKAGDKAKEASGKAGDKADEASGKASDKAQEASGEAGGKSGDVSQDAAETADDQSKQAQDKSGQLSDKYGDLAQGYSQKTGEKAQEYSGKTGEKIGDYSSKADEKVTDATGKYADKVGPSESELNQIDEAAPDNTWHDVPDLSKDNVKSTLMSKVDKYKPFSKDQAKGTAGDLRNTFKGEFDGARNQLQGDFKDAHGQVMKDTEDERNQAQDKYSAAHGKAKDVYGKASDKSQGVYGDVSDQAKGAYGDARDQAKGAYGDARDQAKGAYGDARDQTKGAYGDARGTMEDEAPDGPDVDTNQFKSKAKEHFGIVADKSKDYLATKLPKERRDQIIIRLKKMLVEIQGHPDYQDAIETLLDLAEEYTGHVNTMTQESVGTVKGAHTDSALSIAEKDLKTLLERFANFTSMDDVLDSVKQIYKDADRDPELKKWFQSVDKFIRKCLKEQGYVLKDSSTKEWDALYDKGEFLLRERYRDHIDAIMDEFKFFGEQFDADASNKSFASSVEKLFTSLGTDENGKHVFKPHLVADLTTVIIPAIFENTRYVPIPRIEVSDPMVDAIVENLVIESDNLAPNMVEFSTDNYFRWGRKNFGSKTDHHFMMSATGIQMDLKDVSYYVKKKEGFPSLTDKGLMDIFLGGEGFSFKLNASTAPKTEKHFLKVHNVTVNVKNLKIKIKESNHKFLFSLSTGIVLRVMRPLIQKAIEKVIKDKFQEADLQAYQIHLEAERRAKLQTERMKENPEEKPSFVQNYFAAIQKIFLQKKEEKANEPPSDAKVNLSMTQHNAMFKDVKMPAGVSTKATEFLDLAKKGDKWESPIFSIGRAKESTDLPKPNPIKRKPHNAASGAVRGPSIPSDAKGGLMPGSAEGGGAPATRTHGGTSTSNKTSTTDSTTAYSSNATNGFTNQVNQAFDLKQDTTPNPQSNALYYESVTNH